VSIEEPVGPLQADPKRQASDALRGYLYQALQALHAWLDLQPDHVLYLEGAEDHDVVASETGATVQVKDTIGNITLRSKCVTDAIANYWNLRRAHPDKSISFTLLTRSNIGMERGRPFGTGNKGLAKWQKCHRGDESVAQLADFLSGDPVVVQKLPPELVTFLKKAERTAIYDDLIAPVKWCTAAPAAAAVKDAIDRKLIAHGSRLGIPPSECTRVTDRLLWEVLTVAARKQLADRWLDWARFAVVFEEATSVRVPGRTFHGLLAIQALVPRN
jgi:hypothetical protein